MSHLPRRQQPALAKTRGELRTYQVCDRCDTGMTYGHEWRAGERVPQTYPCGYCGGTGRYLVDTQPIRPAAAQARAVRNAALKEHGRQPYD